MKMQASAWDPPRRQLRQFAWLLALFLGVAAWRLEGTAAGLVVRLTAAAAFGLGTVWPGAFRVVYRTLLVLTFPVGWLVSRVVLGAVFFGLITPLALVFRLAGRDPLCRRLKPEAATYWQPR